MLPILPFLLLDICLRTMFALRFAGTMFVILGAVIKKQLFVNTESIVCMCVLDRNLKCVCNKSRAFREPSHLCSIPNVKKRNATAFTFTF